MKILLKLEEFFLFGLSLFLFGQLSFAWWYYPLLFFLPDLSMAGYLGGAALGAFTYNIVHHKAIAIGLYLAGYFFGNTVLQLTGVILLGHSSLDRVLGYGLKAASSFNETHLGPIGKSGM